MTLIKGTNTSIVCHELHNFENEMLFIMQCVLITQNVLAYCAACNFARRIPSSPYLEGSGHYLGAIRDPAWLITL